MKKFSCLILMICLLLLCTSTFAQELKFEPVEGGKFIYCNNQEGIFENTLLNGENPSYIMNNCGLTKDLYHIYISHINYTGVKHDESKGDLGFDVEVDVEFFAKEDSVIRLNKAFFETTEVYAYEKDGVKHRYEEEWGLFQVCCDMIGAPIYTFDGEQTYFPRDFEAITLEIKAGERIWLSEYLEDYETVHFGKPVHIQGEFEIVSGMADVNVGAFRHNGILKDRSEFTGDATFGSYMRDRCHKGIAHSLPETIASLEYEINDEIEDKTALPVTIFNQYATEGSLLTEWYTHLNPQNDIWSKYNAAESDILPLYYKDDLKLTFYGASVPEDEKDNVWVFDTKHSDTKVYEPALYKGEPALYKPNFELNVQEDNLNSSCSMGNYGVSETYAITVTNNGEKERFLGLNITTASAIIAYKTDSNGIVNQGNLKNVSADKESLIMLEEKFAPGETKTVYFSVILPVNYNGGTKTSLVVSDESQFIMQEPKEKTRVDLLNGVVASDTQYKDLFVGNENSFEVLKGNNTALVRWCAWDGKPWYYYNLWQHANKTYIVDNNGNILSEHIFPVLPVASSWENDVFYVELADGTVQYCKDGVNWENYADKLPEYVPFYDVDTVTAELLPYQKKFHEVIGVEDIDEIKHGVVVNSEKICADIDYDDLRDWLNVYWNFNYDRVIAPLGAFELSGQYVKLWNEDNTKSYTVYSNGGVVVGKYGEPYESHGEIKQNYIWYLPVISNSRSALSSADGTLTHIYFYKTYEGFKDRQREFNAADEPDLPTRNLLITENASDWAKPEIEKAAACNLMVYDLSEKYTQPITRYDFCLLAYRLIATEFKPYVDSRVGLGLAMHDIAAERGIYGATVNKFSDCYYIEVEMLASMGIINGMGDGTFAPDEYITREQAATILSRTAEFLGNKILKESDISYTDSEEISDWAMPSVRRMNAMGIMTGVSETEFAPKEEYTVEQAIATMLRLYESY